MWFHKISIRGGSLEIPSGEGEVSKSIILKESMNETGISREVGHSNRKTLHGRGIDIHWNNTFRNKVIY